MSRLKPLLTLLAALAGVGLAASVAVHVCALLKIPNPFGRYAWGLHVGIFVVWLPAVLAMKKTTANFKQKEIWQAALRGCPPWMKTMLYGFFIYAIVNFVIFIATTAGKNPKSLDPYIELRGFSGHWMVFYAAALGILYSASRIDDEPVRCSGGHEVSPLAKFCPECGAPLAHKSGF